MYRAPTSRGITRNYLMRDDILIRQCYPPINWDLIALFALHLLNYSA